MTGAEAKRRQPVLPTFSYSAEMNVPNYVPARNKKLTPSLFFIICLFVLRKQSYGWLGPFLHYREIK
jgi:hypothetical protein